MKLLFKQEAHKKICRQVAAKFNMKAADIDYIYHQYWATLREEISNTPIRDFEDPSDIEKYFQSYSIMHLGKFYTNKETIDKYKKI